MKKTLEAFEEECRATFKNVYDVRTEQDRRRAAYEGGTITWSEGTKWRLTLDVTDKRSLWGYGPTLEDAYAHLGRTWAEAMHNADHDISRMEDDRVDLAWSIQAVEAAKKGL